MARDLPPEPRVAKWATWIGVDHATTTAEITDPWTEIFGKAKHFELDEVPF